MSDRPLERNQREVRSDNGSHSAGTRRQPDPAQEEMHTAEREQKQGRSPAEWVSLGISTTIVVGLAVVIVYLYVTGGAHVSVIDVRPQINQVRQVGDNYYLPVTVANTGSATASSVMVEVTHSGTNGQRESSQVTIDFLAGHATGDATVVFSQDPRQGEVTTNVLSYLKP